MVVPYRAKFIFLKNYQKLSILLDFFDLSYYLFRKMKIMENTFKTQTTDRSFRFKRTSRHQSEEAKRKISQSLRGKGKSDTHRERISGSLKDYWLSDENFPDDM